ncbi:hypothetical protein BX600DRAFT_512226 [Xylariales sp. PMI_506]|nr:hypothetical protein BX600DRAFT_512226 [Xylariales sp. PMI_506]
MQLTRCLYSPSRALRSVFLASLEGPAICHRGTTTSQHSYPAHYLSPRFFSSTAHQFRIHVPRKKRDTPAVPQKKGEHRLTDNAIPYKWTRLVVDELTDSMAYFAQEGSTLTEPVRTKDVLKKLDRKVHSLVLVGRPRNPTDDEKKADTSKKEGGKEGEPAAEAAPSPADAWARLAGSMQKSGAAPLDPSEPVAICRIYDKQAHAKAAEQKERELRQKERNRKELEINWATAPNDMAHKMRQLRGFLERGRHVEIIIARKRRGREATPAEAAEVLQIVRDTAAAARAKEIKVQGRYPSMVMLTYEGVAKPGNEKALSEEEEEDDDDEVDNREEGARSSEEKR